MNIARLEPLTRTISTVLSRRALAGTLGLGMFRLPNGVEARKKRKRKKRKPTFNAFGCVNVGGFCTTSDHCCSGVCQGKKGKKKCQAHDSGSGCQAGQAEGCAGVSGDCLTSTGLTGVCDTTTGNAGYCGYGFACAACSKDVECQALCGLAAAVCITCPDCDGTPTFQTACVGPSPGACM